jgi:hypothetical protein
MPGENGFLNRKKDLRPGSFIHVKIQGSCRSHENHTDATNQQVPPGPKKKHFHKYKEPEQSDTSTGYPQLFANLKMLIKMIDK